jgi:serine/threonine protein kinase
VGLSFSLLYAPPEVVHAVEAKDKTVRADPAVDMWAIGVIAFELLTRARIFPPNLTKQQVRDQIAGRADLPWEDPARRADSIRQLRILKRTVLACLARDPKDRPTADRLLRSWNRLFDTFTSGSGAVGATTNVLAGRQTDRARERSGSRFR